MEVEEEVAVTGMTETARKLKQSVPNWVKLNEIPHPALIPGFISRRDCLPDGSIDPQTISITAQMNLLSASSLSPSIAPQVGNIPPGMMLEAIHRRTLQKQFQEGNELEEIRGAGCILTLPPIHYTRTADPQAANLSEAAIKTTSELAAMNISCGGVRGRVYLESLKEFCRGVPVPADSAVGQILAEKLKSVESSCGYRIFNMNEEDKEPIDLVKVQNILGSSWPASDLIMENGDILHLMNETIGLDEVNRANLLARIHRNLSKLLRECPSEELSRVFKGVDLSSFIVK